MTMIGLALFRGKRNADIKALLFGSTLVLPYGLSLRPRTVLRGYSKVGPVPCAVMGAPRDGRAWPGKVIRGPYIHIYPDTRAA